MLRRLLPAVVLLAAPAPPPTDIRLAAPVTLNGTFPFAPPADLPTWERRRDELRTQLQVAAGLHPLPSRPPVTATIHGAIDRGDYTVEKVFFLSLPGHTVCGNLYRPKSAGSRPAILCPHGHWRDGRFHDAGAKAADAEVRSGAEDFVEGGRYPLQALAVGLCRLGCTVFEYDMVGYADSQSVPHRTSFLDASSLLHGHSVFGLQTWNSLRAFDFVAGLPEVDATRIGCTGASGGGTQTFVLAALEPRIAAAVPAVMVSTAMQGGCVCENAPHLRVGTGNVELAALIAPRPLAMTAANDWTREIETKGLPELKRLYRLFGAEERVMARTFPQFGHNYNQRAREVAYAWFNTHFRLGLPTVKERRFEPIPPMQLSVFDAGHPRPAEELPPERLAAKLTERDGDTGLPPLPALLHTRLPAAREVTVEAGTGGQLVIGRAGERVPAREIRPANFTGTVAVWLHPDGVASLDGEAVRPFLQRGLGVFAVDAVGTNGRVRPADQPPAYSGFFTGYNRSVIAEQAHDLLTAIVAVRRQPGVTKVQVIGWGDLGPAAALALPMASDAVDRVALDRASWSWERLTDPHDPRLLPGISKYGGLPRVLTMAKPGMVLVPDVRPLTAEQAAAWLQP